MMRDIEFSTSVLANLRELRLSCEADWLPVLSTYVELVNVRNYMDTVLDRLSEHVQNELRELRVQERRLLELHVAKAGKIAPQDVTEEMLTSYAEILTRESTATLRIAKANSKRYGRPLLQLLHPDKESGNAVVFDIVRKAVSAGDSDLLQILMYQYGIKNNDVHVDTIKKRLQHRLGVLQGSRLYSIVRSFVSQPLENTLVQLRRLLNERIHELKCLSTPIPQGKPNDQATHD